MIQHTFFGVDAVDRYDQPEVASGAELIKSLQDGPWGMREFGLRTVDGHRIMIGQDLDV